MKHFLPTALLWTTAFFPDCQSSEEPFTWAGEALSDRIFVSVQIREGDYLYQDKTKITAADSSSEIMECTKCPEPIKEKDAFGEEHMIFPSGLHKWEFSTSGFNPPFNVTVEYQGCGKDPFVCYPPKTANFAIQKDRNKTDRNKETLPENAVSGGVGIHAGWEKIAEKFSVAADGNGYMNEKDFLLFLENPKISGKNKIPFFKNMQGKNFFISLLIILIGGLALNLTPCVLPMIPINIAIIGAGTRTGNKTGGFMLGTVYGAGIAAVYGLLGVLAVVSGTTFGFLNASPVFNIIVGIIFIFLGLSMFDVFIIDFSKFQKSGTSIGRKTLFTVFLMGGISALLAGACVAPVVIAVLIFSGFLYLNGNYLGLLLPFILGAGMALPWPFAGAGLSLLPKPGKWMLWVKYSFGLLIFLFSLYYFYLGYTLFMTAHPDKNEIQEGWLTSLPEALAAAEKEKKLLFIDFWAAWCKNCAAMEETTFRSAKVKESLKRYVKLKFNVENPSRPEIKEVLDHFKVLGLPTYIILSPPEKN